MAASANSSEIANVTASYSKVSVEYPPLAALSGPSCANSGMVLDGSDGSEAVVRSPTKRKRLNGSAKKRLKRERLKAGFKPSDFWSYTTESNRKIGQDASPLKQEVKKLPKLVQPGARKDGNRVRLTVAQRTNPLTAVVYSDGYPAEVLTVEQFELFRKAITLFTSKMPVGQWPKFETSFCRGGVFICIASNPEARAWLAESVAELRPWEGAKLKVSGVEILQKMLKFTVCIPGEPEDVQTVFQTLEVYNPSLKTSTWRSLKVDGYQMADTSGKSFPLVIQVPESHARDIEALEFRPYYHLGRVTFFTVPDRDG